MREVEVVPHDESWAGTFASVRDELSRALGPATTAIHHVGSTSVPGLSAKPVIDVLVETPSLDRLDAAADRLTSLGYQARGEYGVPGRRYFSRPRGSGPRVHVHVFESGNEQLGRHLRFRDYLRNHPADAARYGELKRALADRFVRDSVAYQAGKAEFISEIEKKAQDATTAAGSPPANGERGLHGTREG